LNLAGPNAIGAPRNDVGPNAFGLPENTDPGRAAIGATITPAAASASPSTQTEPVTFTYNVALPGPFETGIEMSSASPGAAIYYTDDLTVPTELSTLYTGPMYDVGVDDFTMIQAVAIAPPLTLSAVTAATGSDFGVIDITGVGIMGVVARDDVRSCTSLISSDQAFTVLAMQRLRAVSGSITLTNCLAMDSMSIPVSTVGGDVDLSGSGVVTAGLIELFFLTSVGGSVNLDGSNFTDLDLSMLDTGIVTAVNAARLDTASISSLRVGSVTLTGCALIESIVDTIFNDIANQVGDAGFAVTSIDLSGGTSAAPTAASAAARVALAGAGTVITTN